MDIEKKIQLLCALGNELLSIGNDLDTNSYTQTIQKAIYENAWFTTESIAFAFKSLGKALQENKIIEWLSKYEFKPTKKHKTIGIVMAGNIPLVGFHDLICVLLSGNKVLAKLSSKDKHLYTIIKDILIQLSPGLESKIEFTEGQLNKVDAIIATGSDNSARYFEYYFSKYPNIIRKNRNSIALISGDETFAELEQLSLDTFTYFGLGCRNVSYLYVPENYNFQPLLKAFESQKTIIYHSKYANNYNYQKTIMLMNQIPFLDNEMTLIKPDASYASPIGVIHYADYKTINDVEKRLENNKNKIQCIVSKTKYKFQTYEFGKAQQPELWEYADNIDTLEFLLKLN